LVRDEGLEAPVYEGLAVVAETLGLPAPHAQVPGWRSALWRVVWRPSVRLGGDLGWASGRHRAHWLPVVCAIAPRVLLRWAWGQLVLSPTVVDDLDPGLRGPFVWRLVRGRVARAASRRRSVRVIRRLRGD
jgi:hypothetical protein